ncbi:uncharacterized protein [Nicotiana sylvestris]|uniref:uncharacterized protein n=1 Tax=Nicotiana sylvestris TaxID=4096 RepID=UPI00388CEA25
MTESFREYAIKWREQLITIFLEAQEPDYFQNMMSAMGRPFAEAIKIGEMVENGLKTGRIVRAPAPRASRPQQQKFWAPYNARPRQDYGREQRPTKKFSPLAESYSSLFQKLKQIGMIGPIASHHMYPDSHGFQANARCKYHSGAPRHITDDCWTLKRAVERLIFEKLIVVANGEDPPNVTNNLLPAHNDVHFVGMIGRDQEYKPIGRAEMIVGAIQKGTILEVSPSRDVPLIVKGAQSSNKATLFVLKISRLEVHSSVPSPRLYVLGGHPVTRQKQGGTKGITEPIIIKPIVQPPMTNTKTTHWDYNKTVMTYKGKEIIEEVGETGVLTRSGRCYSLEELRKAKKIREGQLPIKKPVTEAEAEEFLKKMKVQDYSIIDQLRKTPAQISLLSLLIHSKKHARVLIKVMNEAHISEETTMNQLEKMANRFFEVNRISFTDDELPKEGAGHNRALNLMVKCEGNYVKRVMVDGGSSVDICPLSTLQSMKINIDRIRPSNVCIRAFDGSARDTIGEINLTMTIGTVDFEIVFQVVDMVTSYNFLLGRKRLRASLQGILEPISPFSNQGTFGLGFRPTQADKNKAKHRKKNGWVLQQPIPYIFYTFVKPRLQEGQNSSAHANIDEICHDLSRMFSEVNMIQAGEGTSRADMQLIDPDTMLTNWEATPLPTRKESCFVNAGFNNMTCMQNSRPDLKKLSNVEIMHQEVEYDEDEVVEEIKENNCTKHEIQSFVDCYVGYRQILMDEDDAEKTAFTTPWGTYYYRVMPFGLKNAGATYMRAMTTIFHDMMHKEVEIYVNDVIIKSKTQADHVCDLKKFFERLRRYDLKLNPAKCAFGVPSGKLLNFIVSRRGIELDPSKIKSIRDLPPSKNKKEVMRFLGRFNYISRFIAQLTTTCEPIFKLLTKDASIKWMDDCQKAFDRIKDYLSKPHILVPPELDRPLFLYLSMMDNSFGCVLGQHDATCKKEHAIYYLSKKFTNYEVKHTLLERTCCALTWVDQKLRYYLLAYTTYLISRMDPLKYIFQKPMPTGRLAKMTNPTHRV